MKVKSINQSVSLILHSCRFDSLDSSSNPAVDNGLLGRP